LQHSKIALRFNLEQKKVLGEVTHSLSVLRDGTAKIAFDSAGLTIQKVTVNKAAAKFETTAEKLIIPLASEAKAGDNSISPFAMKASLPRECISFCRTRTTRTVPARSGRRANRKIRTTICPHTIIQTIASRPKQSSPFRFLDHRFEWQAHQRQRRRQRFENVVLERIRPQLNLPDYGCRR